MDKQVLVERLNELFEKLHQRGIEVTDFRATPTYRLAPRANTTVGLVIPSLKDASVSQKVDAIVDWMFNLMDINFRKMVGTILVYGSSEEMNENLDQHEGVVVVSDYH